ncbi:zinc-ribbon domain-containing protein [Treponema putidum]|uniref:zinc-ribbon domain-containing protein n=1 Tax=Treponema putidum TaxID=221027 RepID=UPI00210282A2|nr:zinc ribbon domain-containing protein [Treponema putidum]UTY30983.1 zinc ribbon domain-containing protein [Treponema putidum]
MNQYCVKCGKEIRKDAAFCPHCGQKLSSTARQTDDWNEFGNFLAHSSLSLAKGFLYLLMGGIIFASILISKQ